MLTPALDVLCVGGASILVAVVVLVTGFRLPAQYTGWMYLTNFLINAPHFLVSYVLLYGSRQRREAYLGVSAYVPLALLLWMLFGLAVFARWPVVLGAMAGTGSILLAWHYTGQAWGMMASFGFIEGRRFTNLERRLVRTNLYTLLAWHVMWAIVVARNMFDPQASAQNYVLTPGFVNSLYGFVSVLAVASSVFGIAGLALQTRRTGRPPTLRMLLPWIAVHVWYVLLYREPAAIFWAQNAHALQYLIFPMRVEMNRVVRRKPRRLVSPFGRHMIGYYALTVSLGLFVMQLVPEGAQIGLQRSGFGVFPVQIAVVAFINVHHYFIDNFIWKIRNPVVREDLFSHLQGPRRS